MWYVVCGRSYDRVESRLLERSARRAFPLRVTRRVLGIPPLKSHSLAYPFSSECCMNVVVLSIYKKQRCLLPICRLNIEGIVSTKSKTKATSQAAQPSNTVGCSQSITTCTLQFVVSAFIFNSKFTIPFNSLALWCSGIARLANVRWGSILGFHGWQSNAVYIAPHRRLHPGNLCSTHGGANRILLRLVLPSAAWLGLEC